MKSIVRHKTFYKDMRNVRLSENQVTKLFLYVAKLLNNKVLPTESKDHALQGEWNDFREAVILLIYQVDDAHVYLTRMGSHAQLFKNM